MPWCYSTDNETFFGKFATEQDAISAALAATKDGDTFSIGQSRPPIQPEDMWDAEDWLEHVSVQDDYRGDFGDDWDLSSLKQRQELESLVRPILAEWIDRHGLRPTHYYVDEAVEFGNVTGMAVEIEPIERCE